jgi:uncharacterized RDD family membrane protein YckC
MRILIPILSIEIVRIPFLMATISAIDINDVSRTHVWLYIGACNVFPWIPILSTLRARRDNGFATVWDYATGTRVVVKPKGIVRPSIEPAAQPEIHAEAADSLGPYQIIREMVPGKWIVATDPVLRRQVWLLRRNSLELSPARQNLARSGRLRWLQKVETAAATWDAFEATQGVPFSSLVEDGKRVPWSSLRHWLHDLASELWAATGDQTLPAELSLDHVWVTAQGHTVLLDDPWPDVKTPAERIPIGDVAGQQRFLNAIAACEESTSLSLHARPMLQNLEDRKFEKLSFLTGTLRGLLDKPAEVSKGIRAGSIFMLPLYVWIVVCLGTYTAERYQEWYDSVGWIVMTPTMVVLGARALIQLLELPFRTTCSHSIFGLAVVNAKGERADISNLFVRWAIVWLPLFLPMSLVALLIKEGQPTAGFISALVVLSLWIGAAVYAVIHPHRGLHDRLAGTWVVRR